MHRPGAFRVPGLFGYAWSMQVITCTCGTGRPCRVPHGLWIKARERNNGCRCGRRCPDIWCEDVGRVSPDTLPAHCCARRVPLEQAKAERLAWRIANGRL